MKKRKIILGIFLFFVIMFLVSFFAIKKAYEDNVHTKFTPISHKDEEEVTPPSNKERLNVLVLGMEHTRTDMIMVATFDPQTKALDMISVPRDTYVENSYTNPTFKKINSVYELPQIEGGVERLAREVSRILGITIHDYVMIDYKAVGEITDAVGGIDVDIPFTMYYDDPYDKPPLHIYFPKGPTHLSGDKAIKYLRWRKNNDGTHGAEGDEGRIKRQQAFIAKLLDKALNPTTLPEVIEVAFNNVKTSIDFSRAMGLVADASSIKKEDIHFYNVIGVNAYFNRLWYFLADDDKTQSLMQKIIKGEMVLEDDLNPSSSFEASALRRDNSNYINSNNSNHKSQNIRINENDELIEIDRSYRKNRKTQTNETNTQINNNVNNSIENDILKTNDMTNTTNFPENTNKNIDTNTDTQPQEDVNPVSPIFAEPSVNENTQSPIPDSTQNPTPTPNPAPAPIPTPQQDVTPVPAPAPAPESNLVEPDPNEAPIF